MSPSVQYSHIRTFKAILMSSESLNHHQRQWNEMVGCWKGGGERMERRRENKVERKRERRGRDNHASL